MVVKLLGDRSPALIFDRRHGRLMYQADRDNVRCDAGDCHESARTAGAAPPASLRRKDLP